MKSYTDRAKEWVAIKQKESGNSYPFEAWQYVAVLNAFAQWLDAQQEVEKWNCCGTFDKSGNLLRPCVQPECKCSCHQDAQEECGEKCFRGVQRVHEKLLGPLPHQDAPTKCDAGNITYTSNPAQYKCIVCGRGWTEGEPVPTCHKAPPKECEHEWQQFDHWGEVVELCYRCHMPRHIIEKPKEEPAIEELAYLSGNYTPFDCLLKDKLNEVIRYLNTKE